MKGFANSFAVLLLLWVSMYSYQHSSTVQQFDEMAMAINNITASTFGSGSGVGAAVETAATPPSTSTITGGGSEF
jgi:hypothetical protein